jgi:hypothetical protein
MLLTQRIVLGRCFLTPSAFDLDLGHRNVIDTLESSPDRAKGDDRSKLCGRFLPFLVGGVTVFWLLDVNRPHVNRPATVMRLLVQIATDLTFFISWGGFRIWIQHGVVLVLIAD